jgi:long-chain acyl-CoA synthetase
VIEHLRPSLAAFKLPTHIDIRTEELPRTASGKIVKRQLREELAAKASAPGSG